MKRPSNTIRPPAPVENTEQSGPLEEIVTDPGNLGQPLDDVIVGVLEVSWVPPALLLDGAVVASLRGIMRELTDSEKAVLVREWRRRGGHAIPSETVPDLLGWPKGDRP